MMRRAIILFIGAILLSLVALFPLRLAVAAMGAGGPLFTARAAEGTIWNGVLRDISIDGVSLGDFSAKLSPFGLITGQAAIDLHALADADTKGRLIATANNFGVDHVTAKLALPGAFAPLPVQSIDLRDASVRFAGNRCVSATGLIHVQLNGKIGGFTMGQDMVGTPRCEANVFSLALASASAMERIIMRVVPDGQYTAKVIIKAVDTTAATKLASAGFRETAAGHVIEISGRF